MYVKDNNDGDNADDDDDDENEREDGIDAARRKQTDGVEEQWGWMMLIFFVKESNTGWKKYMRFPLLKIHLKIMTSRKWGKEPISAIQFATWSFRKGASNVYFAHYLYNHTSAKHNTAS